jgi:hypothetical protein
MYELIAPPVVFAIVFTVIVHRWRFFHVQEIPKNWIFGAWVLKMIAGIAFWMVYTIYYSDPTESDALRYFKDALTIKAQWYQNKDVFWSFMLGQNMDHPEYIKLYDQLVAWSSEYRYGLSNDCSTIIRINVLLSFISFENFHVHTLCMSFMCFIGYMGIYRAFKSLLEGKEKWLFAACFLLPSVLFWSSSVLKEAPLFMCLGLLLLSIQKIFYSKKEWQYFIIFGFSFTMLIYIKVYVVVSLIPSLISLTVIKLSGQKHVLLKFILTHIICFIVAEQAHHFFRGGDFIYVLHKKQIDFYNLAQLTDAGSAIYIPPVSNASNFFLHYPEAFFLTYFRPHLFEAKSLVYLVFSIENAVYLLICIGTLFFFKRPKESHLPMILMIVSYLLIIAAILGNCVPILGAMVRYKVVALPFLMILCAICFDTLKAKMFFARLSQNKTIQ